MGRSRRRTTLRQRVFAGFVGAAVMILLVNFVAISLVRGTVLGQLDQTLSASAQVVESALAGTQPTTSATTRPATHSGTHSGTQPAPPPAPTSALGLGLLSGYPSVVRVTPAGGAPMVAGDSVGTALLDTAGPLPLGGTTLGGWRFLTIAGTQRSRITVGESLSAVQVTNGLLSSELLLSSVVTLVILVILLVWVVSLGVRPFTRIAAVARRISDGGRGERILVPARARGTEYDDVACALNAMVAGFERSLDAEEALTAQLRQFVADAGHELRTPLTSISGYTELLEHGGLPPERRRAALARVSAEAARMRRLVESLLALARAEGGALPVDGLVDLGALVADLVADHGAIEPAGSHAVRTLLTPGVLVRGNSDQLAVVIANLLSNLREHTPPATTASLTVAVLEAPDGAGDTVDGVPGGQALLRYVDDGPGVAEPEQIFVRFWQADGSRHGASSGLGMAISAAAVLTHGGTLAAHDTPGGGLTVEFRVPRAGAEPASARAVLPPTPER